jgi:hypothetical protein
MAVFHLPRSAADDDQPVPVPPLVAPRFSVDGWTLAGTPLHGRVPRAFLGELTALLHGAATGLETPWTYERAAQLLEECGEREQALAACEAWFALPEHRRAAHASRARGLVRRRQRLRALVGAAREPS